MAPGGKKKSSPAGNRSFAPAFVPVPAPQQEAGYVDAVEDETVGFPQSER